MTTYRELVSSISSTLKQVNKNRKIEPFEILYWILLVSSKLKSQHITNSFERDGWISGEYLTEFNVKVKAALGKKFFDLPASILNYKSREGGLDFITYNLQGSGEIPDLGGNSFTRITASGVKRLYYNKHEEPSPDNPYFYRISDRIFLLGIEKIRVDDLNIGLVLGTSIEDIDSLDEEIKLPDHLMSILMMEVLQLGQFGLSIPDNNETIQRTQKIMTDDKQ